MVKLFLFVFLLNIFHTPIIGSPKKVFNCGEFYDEKNASYAIQQGINSCPDIVLIPYMGKHKPWRITTIFIENNKKPIEILFEKNVIIEDLNSSFFKNNSGAPIFKLISAKDVTFTGNNANINMHKERYFDGEGRIGIKIMCSRNININRLNITNTAGDGIYVGCDEEPSSNISINNCNINLAARNGISIINAKYVTIFNCQISNTGINNPMGVAASGPYCGIDIEPNKIQDIAQEIIIKDNIITNNKNHGIYIYGANKHDTPIKLCINNNTLSQNGGAGIILYTTQNIKNKFLNNSFLGTLSGADGFGMFLLRFKYATQIKTQHLDIFLHKNKSDNYHNGFSLTENPPTGWHYSNINATLTNILSIVDTLRISEFDNLYYKIDSIILNKNNVLIIDENIKVKEGTIINIKRKSHNSKILNNTRLLNNPSIKILN